MFARMHLTLTPLKVPDAGWDDTNFHITAVPVDDLIDPEGRMVLQNIDLSGTAGRAVLQDAIEQMLALKAR